MNTLSTNQEKNIQVDINSVIGPSSDSIISDSSNKIFELFSNSNNNKRKEEDHGTFIQQDD